MTSLKILVVEDVILTAKDLRQTLEKAGHRVTSIARTLQAARESAIADPPDLALIDIRLENSTGDGIETAKELLIHHRMPIIYLTANSELSQFQAAQETHPAAYLLKPFKANELLFNVRLAYSNFRASTEDVLRGRLMLPTNGGLEMVVLDDIMYLKADGVYSQIIMADGISHLVSTGLGQLEQYFRPPDFLRISRSNIVNLTYIKRLKDNELLLVDGQTTLPVPVANRNELLQRLTVIRTKPGRKR